MPTTEEVVMIPLAKLEPHPDNPRGPKSFTKAKLKPLADAMDENGVSPLIVRALDGGKKFQILAGHRREEALELDGAKEAPCIVRQLDERAALLFVLADNVLHEAPDPFLEARAIKKLRAFGGVEGADVPLETIARSLGWSVRTVSRRLELLNLCKEILEERMALDSIVANWPVTWLEAVVQLDPTIQAKWFKEEPVDEFRTLEEVEGSVNAWLRDLAKAPWDVADPTLFAKAGACTACPKNSANTPGLFGAIKGEKPGVGKCRDAICWKAKNDRHVKERVTAIVEKEPDVVCLRGAVWGGYDQASKLEQASTKAPKGHEVLDNASWAPCAKDDRGAKKGVLISGPTAGKTTWFKRQNRYGGGAPQAATVPSLKAKLELHEKEHAQISARSFCEHVATIVTKVDDRPPPADVLGLLAIVGIGRSEWNKMPGDYGDAVAAVAAEHFEDFIWPSVRMACHDALRDRWAADVEQQRWLARTVLGAVVDATEVTAIEEKCDADTPVSDELAKLREEAAAKPAKKPRGKKAKAEATAPVDDLSDVEAIEEEDTTEGGEA